MMAKSIIFFLVFFFCDILILGTVSNLTYSNTAHYY